MTKLSRTTRRVLALAILFVAIYIPIMAFIVPSIEEYIELEDRTLVYAELLQRFRAAAASQPQMRTELQQTRSDVNLSESFLSGENPALVAAELQQLINAIVQRARGQLGSTQVLPMTMRDEFPRIGIRVRLDVTTAQLLAILHAVEANRPYLFVDQLAVNTRRRRARNPARKNAGETLQVTLDLYGYMRPQAAAPPRAGV